MFLVLVVGLTFAVFHFALSGRSSHHSSSSSHSTAVPKPPTDLLSGLGTLLTDIRGRFGDTMGYSLHVRAEDASLYRADPASTGNQTLYSYIDGKWQSGGGNPTPPSGTGLADLGKFDVAAVTATVKSAPQTLHVPAGDKVYLVVYGQPDGSLTMRIFDDGKGDSDMEINPDGSIKEVHLH